MPSTSSSSSSSSSSTDLLLPRPASTHSSDTAGAERIAAARLGFHADGGGAPRQKDEQHEVDACQEEDEEEGSQEDALRNERLCNKESSLWNGGSEILPPILRSLIGASIRDAEARVHGRDYGGNSLYNDTEAHAYRRDCGTSISASYDGGEDTGLVGRGTGIGIRSKTSSKPRLVWDGSGFLPPTVKSLLGFPERDYRRLASHPKDELCQFRCSLFWFGLDQSTTARISVSWFIAILLSIVIPIAYLCLVSCSSCDSAHQQPFDRVVHTSEAILAAISFACLSKNLRKYGLRRFLFLDQINQESFEVQSGYNQELHKAFRLLECIILPAFAVELVHQVWWFTYATVNFPFIQSSAMRKIVMCFAIMVSWFYKTTVFLLPCILFRLMCYLQNLRFEGYIKMLECVPEVSVILREYMRLRQQLNIISHRHRMFIVLSLVTVTASQFMFLLMITATAGSVNFFRAGNLGVCSVVQLIGFAICLHGAARITHRAQRIVSIVSQWHAMSTCQTYSTTMLDDERNNPAMQWVDAEQLLAAESDKDLSSALNMYSTFSGKIKNDLASFQMRQAFVTYVQHSSAGITIFGFLLDRIHLQMVFMIELSLVLWVLGKTVGISLS